MPVAVRILGPLEVVHRGQPVPIRGSKERALLVRLALDPGRVVSCDRLVQSLWEGDPPASAEVSVRVLVSRVRKALGALGADDVIRTSPPGYVLAADEVDAARFEQLSARGRQELADGRPDRAAATFAEALTLWRGDTLAEVVAGDLQAEAVRLEQTRLATLEARIQADLACGRHGEVLGELEALCRSHPLHEGLWALWITALYRAHRQADALAAYQKLRRVLAGELGIDPSPALQRLEGAVLRQEPSLAGPAVELPPSPAVTTVPFPAPLAVAERAPLLGRGAALDAARAAWRAVAGGGSGVLLVSGEAGIGKSRLVRELARDVHGEGAVVLYGRCDEELAVPYRPFVECLGHLVARMPDEVLATVDPHRLGELTRLVPSLATRRPGLPSPADAGPDVERYLLFGGAGALLSAVTQHTPVVVILDDLHWADRPTLLLLRHLAGLRLGRVLLVAAYREREQAEGPLVDTLAGLSREPAVTRIALGGLGADDTAALVAAATGGAPGPAGADLVAFLQRETAGNPFFLVEMLSHLRDTGVVTRSADEGWTTTGPLTAVTPPEGVRDVLRARLSRLGPDVARVLADAAVVGQEFDLDLLARTTGLAVEHLLDVLEAAGRTGLVVESTGQPGRFRFAHALVQRTLYDDIGRTRRALAHARVGAAMESLGGRQPGEVAFHFLAGITSGPASKAVDHARAAGAQALATSAPEEAVRWYSAVLHALPPSCPAGERARALIDLGVAQRQAGQPAYRDTLLAAARAARGVGADDLLVEAALACDRGGFSALGQVDEEKLALLEAALAVTTPDSTDRARLLAGMAAELTWHPDHARRVALADEALAVARRSGDPATVLFALLRPAPARWVPETSDQRVALFREALDLAEQADDLVARSAAVQLLAPTLLEAASTDRIDDALDSAVTVAAEVGEPFMRLMSLLVRGCMAIVHGQLERAEQDAEEVLRVGRQSGQPDAEEMYVEPLFLIRWQQGRLAEVLPRLRTLAERLPEVSSRWAGLAFAEAICGDRERARALLAEAARKRFGVFYGPPWLGCMCQWADVAAELDEPEAAAVLYRRLLPWKHLFATAGPLPVQAVSLALGRLAAVLGQTEAAEAHFAEAMRVHEAVRSPFGRAQTALYWGRLLQRRDAERATPLLAAALELAEQHGFGDVKIRAGQALTEPS